MYQTNNLYEVGTFGVKSHEPHFTNDIEKEEDKKSEHTNSQHEKEEAPVMEKKTTGFL